MSDQPDEKRVLFSSIWLFRELPSETIAQLLRYIRSASYRSNQTIFNRNDPGTSMMVVASGRVKIRSKSWDGREVVFNLIERGEVFGEIALLDGRERTADAVAMGPTVLYVLERRDFLPLIRRNTEVGIRLLDVLCQRLRRTSQQVEDLLFLEHPARLAKTLLWLAKRYGAKSRDGVAIELKLSQRELGTFVGVRREAMNRQLNIWRAEGLLSLKAGRITIPDMAAFEALAEGLDQ